jgi:hypothetical protein
LEKLACDAGQGFQQELQLCICCCPCFPRAGPVGHGASLTDAPATNSGQYILDGKIMGRRENNGFMHEVRFRPVYGLDLTSPFGQGPKQVQTARLSRCFRIVSGATNKKTRPKARLGF